MPFVTIDAPHSTDLDDAISVSKSNSGWRVDVAVADVSKAVPIGSVADRDAFERAATRYNSTRAVEPMLDRQISEMSASLTAGEARSVVIFELSIPTTLLPRTISIRRDTIVVAERLDHAGAVSGARRSDAIGQLLGNGFELARQLYSARVRGGAIAAFDERNGVVANEEGRLLHVGQDVLAHLLVQELMILTNRLAAEKFAGAGVPLLFRNHRAKHTASRQSFVEDIDHAAHGMMTEELYEARRTLLQKATLSPFADGHFALSSPAYAWFTSPIRRYADLINHRIALATLDGRPQPYDPGDLARIAAHLNEAALEAAGVLAEAKRAAAFRVAHLTLNNAGELSQRQFSQLIRGVSEGKLPLDQIVGELDARSHAGTLTSKDLYRIIRCDDADARELAVQHLIRRPEDAEGILNHGVMIGELALTRRKTVRTGANEPGFRTSILLSGGGRQTSTEGTSHTKRMSRHVALVRALSAHFHRRITEGAGMRPTDQDAGNPKGRLLEHCAARKLPAPTFIHTTSGPAHSLTFFVTVSIAGAHVGMTGTGEASTIRRAQARAAAALLEQLTSREAISL